MTIEHGQARRYPARMGTAALVESEGDGRRKWSRTLRKLAGVSLDLALPPLCPACREPVGAQAALCASCWSKLSFIAPPYCERLGTPFAYDPGPGVAVDAGDRRSARLRARTGGRVLRRLLADPDPRAEIFRSARSCSHARPLDGARRARAASGRRGAGAGAATLRRLWARRFNQSAALAKIVSQASGVPLLGDALKRVKATLQQVGLTASERALNVQGGFAVADRSRVAGRRLILIDDVLTSGATIDACARALNRAGAARVDVLVFARVVNIGRSPI